MSGPPDILTAAFDSVPDGMLIVDEAGRVLMANAAARRLFPVLEKDARLGDCLSLDDAGVRALLRPLKAMTGQVPISLPVRLASGDVERLQAKGQRLRDAPDGVRFVLRIPPADSNSFAALSVKVSELDREVRQRRKAQKTAEEALEVNRLLTKELHHRVNNNLQLQVSLLRRSARATDNAEVHDFVQTAIGRIRSMSAGLDLIYRSGEGPGVGVEDLLKKLSSQIEETLPPGWQIGVTVESRFSVSTVQVAPLALIINEIAADAVRRSPGTGGELRLICRSVDGAECLDIAQTHPAPPAAGSEARALIDTLARQAGARIAYSETRPYQTRLIFERG